MTRWRISPDVARVDDGARVVAVQLLDEASQVPRALEGTAGEIWRSLEAAGENGITQGRLTSEIAEMFGAAPSQIADDVAAFLQDLQAARFVCEVRARTPHGGLVAGD